MWRQPIFLRPDTLFISGRNLQALLESRFGRAFPLSLAVDKHRRQIRLRFTASFRASAWYRRMTAMCPRYRLLPCTALFSCLNPPLSPLALPFFDMTDSSPTGLAILKAVRASLRLVSSSSELLTISQLLAVKHELCETFTVINAQIQVEQSGTFSKNIPHRLAALATHSCFKDDRKVVIDLTDWESSSDEGKEDENEDASAVGGKYLIPLDHVATRSRKS